MQNECSVTNDKMQKYFTVTAKYWYIRSSIVAWQSNILIKLQNQTDSKKTQSQQEAKVIWQKLHRMIPTQ